MSESSRRDNCRWKEETRRARTFLPNPSLSLSWARSTQLDTVWGVSLRRRLILRIQKCCCILKYELFCSPGIAVYPKRGKSLKRMRNNKEFSLRPPWPTGVSYNRLPMHPKPPTCPPGIRAMEAQTVLKCFSPTLTNVLAPAYNSVPWFIIIFKAPINCYTPVPIRTVARSLFQTIARGSIQTQHVILPLHCSPQRTEPVTQYISII